MIHLKRFFPLILLCMLAQPIVSMAQIPQVMVGDTGRVKVFRRDGTLTSVGPCNVCYDQYENNHMPLNVFMPIRLLNRINCDSIEINEVYFIPPLPGTYFDTMDTYWRTEHPKLGCGQGAGLKLYIEAVALDSITYVDVVNKIITFPLDTLKKTYSSRSTLLSFYNNIVDSTTFSDWQLMVDNTSQISFTVDSGSSPISSYEAKPFTRKKQFNLIFSTTLKPTDTAQTFTAKLKTHSLKAGKDTVFENDLTFIMPALPQVGVKQEREIESVFSIYPNPSASEATIFISLNKPEEVNIEVYDLLGNKKIVFGSGNYPAGNYQFRLNKDQLPQGEYFVRLQTDKTVSTKKFVVQ